MSAFWDREAIDGWLLVDPQKELDDLGIWESSSSEYCLKLREEDEDVPEFIKSVFPKSEIEHVSVRNVFIINGEMIDFDYMKCDSVYIYLEFVESN